MIDDEEELHRLVWSPDDFDGDQLLSSAFRKADLSGKAGRYLSVSSVTLLDRAAEVAIAEAQSAKADGKTFFRERACSALLHCGTVRAAFDRDGERPFEVSEEPLPENPAHCGIRNITGKSSGSYLNHLRILLVEAVHCTGPMDAVIDEIMAKRDAR